MRHNYEPNQEPHMERGNGREPYESRGQGERPWGNESRQGSFRRDQSDSGRMGRGDGYDDRPWRGSEYQGERYQGERQTSEFGPRRPDEYGSRYREERPWGPEFGSMSRDRDRDRSGSERSMGGMQSPSNTGMWGNQGSYSDSHMRGGSNMGSSNMGSSNMHGGSNMGGSNMQGGWNMQGGSNMQGNYRSHQADGQHGSMGSGTQQQHRGRGPKDYVRADATICEDLCERLEDADVDPSNVSVEVNEGEVKLSGKIDSRWSKRMIEDIAFSVRGVKDVHNDVHVESNSQSSEGKQTGAAQQKESGGDLHSKSSSNDGQRRQQQQQQQRA